MEEFRSRPLDYRVNECKRLANKYQDRVPIIIRPGNARTPDVPNFRYLVPKDKTVGEFVAILRRTTKLKSHQALFVLVGTAGSLLTSSSTIMQAYQEHREEDGFLYVTYTLENTFG